MRSKVTEKTPLQKKKNMLNNRKKITFWQSITVHVNVITIVIVTAVITAWGKENSCSAKQCLCIAVYSSTDTSTSVVLEQHEPCG